MQEVKEKLKGEILEEIDALNDIDMDSEDYNPAVQGIGELTDKYIELEKCAEAKAFFSERMNLVRDAAEQADDELADYILYGVTEGVPYNTLVTRMSIPCSKDTYYDRYRKFFWILNKTRK